MKYHLVLEKKPGDFMPIDLDVIAKSDLNTTLAGIDNFTKRFTLEELKDYLDELHLIPDNYSNCELKIINENKYRFKLLLKTDTLSLEEFFKENISDKNIMNKFINIYHKYVKDIDDIKEAVKNEDYIDLLDTLYSNDYEIIRNIYIYLKDNI